ncbi:MAG: T9SS C-terminal target domain-containing protein [Bacteroidetes bacterium]|nr:MAG: T9SS C-terminal target domain-containing protein [Bacteroidota bacterium]
MKRLSILTMCLLILGTARSQEFQSPVNPEDGTIRCATVEAEEARRRAHPELGTVEDFEAWLQEKMAHTDLHASREVITIPVIVHVVHNGEPVGIGTNLRYAQISSQIDVLNEDFRRKEGTSGFNADSVGADVEIEFCLANLGQDGRLLEEKGVHRINRQEMGWDEGPYSIGYVNQFIKPATIWDPTRYYNIWVLPLSNSILGFAQTPVQSTLPDLAGSSTPTTDGVVINYLNFGREGNVRPPFNKGRTTTHETGHWLGLYHTWGPSNNATSCDIDDFCDDTPLKDGPSYGCQKGTFSCGGEVMVENYMDYSNDACMNIFTLCQKARMRTVMEHSPRRKELLQSIACSEIVHAPVAQFSYSDTITCDGRMQFFDQSLNIAVDWLWDFGNGVTSTEKNPKVRFDTTGFYDVSLIANNPMGVDQISKRLYIVVNAPPVNAGEDISGCINDQVRLSAGVDDPNASYVWFPIAGIDSPLTASPTLTIMGTNAYTLTVTFPGGCEVRDTILVSGAPKPTTLALPIGSITIQSGGSAQLNAIGADHYNWSPPTGLSDPNIPNPIASPEVTTLYTVTGFNDAGCEKKDSVLVVVEGVGITPFSAVGRVFPAYPNPASEGVTLSADLHSSGKLRIRLYDLSGREVAGVFEGQVGAGKWQLNWQPAGHISAGSYFLSWEMNDARHLQKLMLTGR